VFHFDLLVFARKGLDLEGLFRKSGNNTNILQLKARFDKGDDVDLNEITGQKQEKKKK
jgi:hypothetical protein